MVGENDQRLESEAEDSYMAERSPESDILGEGAQPEFPIPQEFLDDVPEEHRLSVTRAVSTITQFAAPVFNPIFQKVTSDHVSRIIDNAENESVREHDAGGSRRRYQFAYFLLGGAIAVGLIVFFTLTDNRGLLPPIVTGVTGFLGGLAVGQRFRS